MQILEIVLYNRAGNKRILPLRPGELNIITGSSATGKSAIIAIVDYCLGRGECLIPEGVIRDTVSWYGLRLQLTSGQMFIARENPPYGRRTTNRVYIEQGDVVFSLETPPDDANTTSESLEDLLTQLIGISPNLNVPPPGQTRQALPANIRHALLYCFQQQGEIANQSILFHRQSEDFMTQAIRDTLPYFLGAIQEDRLALEQELSRMRRELRRAERAVRDAEAILGVDASRGLGLLAEAIEVGLLNEQNYSEDPQAVIGLLNEAAQWSSDTPAFANEGRYQELQTETRQLRSMVTELSDRLAAARTFAQELEGYTSEAHQQELRLESIGIFPGEAHNAETCPLCQQELQTAVPTVDGIRQSLDELKSNLQVTRRERPQLRAYIASLENERDDLLNTIRGRNEALTGIVREQQLAARDLELNARRDRVVGRISLWLESRNSTSDTSILQNAMRQAQARVAQLEQQLDPEDKEQRLTSILNRIGARMTTLAQTLDLEHSGNPVRLDLRNVTVVVDREDRPIPLAMIGSGKNWLGYHLITHFALHEHFRHHQRPVPAFLFLDQPSQVYYPPDRDAEFEGALGGLSSEDRNAVLSIYELFMAEVAVLSPSFQVIVTDHADLDDPRFQASIVERWRGGQALVPQEWITA